jgi:hypothetical protein
MAFSPFAKFNRFFPKWWPHTVQKGNVQVPPTVRLQQREKTMLQRIAQRNGSDISDAIEINLVPEEEEQVTHMDKNKHG